MANTHYYAVITAISHVKRRVLTYLPPSICKGTTQTPPHTERAKDRGERKRLGRERKTEGETKRGERGKHRKSGRERQ